MSAGTSGSGTGGLTPVKGFATSELAIGGGIAEGGDDKPGPPGGELARGGIFC